jgi:hypothetical protein
MNLFTNLFGDSGATGKPVNGGNGLPNSPPRDDASIALAVSKAVAQLSFVAKNYGFGLCEGSLEDHKADWQTMLKFNDLNSLRLQLLGHEGCVQMEYKVEFKPGAGGRILDNGESIELPVVDRKLLADRRVLINRNGLESAYKHLLRLPWGSAPKVGKAQGTEYSSDHAAKITGNRQSATFFAPDAARRRFVITSPGPGPFRFAKEIDSGMERIFVDLRHWPAGYEVRVGASFTAVLIQTRKGMQVRSIRVL